MNVILAVNDKKIEKFMLSGAIPEATVLTSLKRREDVVDSVYHRRPNLLILSADLTGKLDMREIVSAIKKSRPEVRILYIYGQRDEQYKLFLDFLVRNGVYDIILDDFDNDILTNAIYHETALAEVKGYLLSKEEYETLKDNEPEPVQATTTEETKTNVLVVEKYIGNMTVAVGSLFPRTGCTHLSISMAAYLQSKKVDVGLVVAPKLLANLRDFYEVGEVNKINGIYIYDNEVIAKQNHKFVVVDCGCINTAEQQADFTAHNIPILLCPSSPWEIDALTNYLDGNVLSSAVLYAFYPISEKPFKEYRRNLQQGNCRSYRLFFEPEIFSYSANSKTFNDMLKPIFEQQKKIKKG